MSNNNTEQRLFTAVCFAENQGQTPNTLAVHLLEDDSEDSANTSKTLPDQAVESLMSRCRLIGVLLGFLVQIVNVLGTTYMYLRWGERHAHQDVSYDSEADRLLHWVVFLASQAVSFLYFAMWMSLSASLTRPGVKFAQEHFFSKDVVPSKRAVFIMPGVKFAQEHFFSKDVVPSKRAVFIMGVNFYVGVVVGVFLAWASVDAFLGLPVSILPMLSVLLFGLAISYIMVWCYGQEEEIDNSEYDNDTTSEC